MNMKKKLQQSIIQYLPDGILNFLLVTGSLCGFLSAFEVSYDLPVAFLALFLFSCAFAIVCHWQTRYRLLFYLAFFTLYLAGVTKAGSYLNGGFYIIVNDVVDAMSLYLNTTNYQEYQIVVENSIPAVTLFVIFAGGLALMLINAAAAEKKHVITTLLFTLPLPLIPIYIHQEPGMVWETFLISGYLLLLFGHCQNNNKQHYSKMRILKNQLFLTLGIVGITFLLTVLTHLLMPLDTYNDSHEDNSFKTAGSDNVASFLIFGFSGFFNNYTGAGGMSGGLLGGINTVRPDYETDLIVEFTPYSNETLYLKGFTGVRYTGSQWLSQESLGQNRYHTGTLVNQDTNAEYDALKNDFAEGGSHSSRARLRLKNVGASSFYEYLPYYSSADDTSSVNSSKDEDGYTEYTFYPYHELENRTATLSEPDEIYLELSDKNRQVIASICDANEINGSTDEIIAKLQDYFAENFTYTMSPGKTPSKEDFVNYFLTKSKKGYCSHFATAAALILRYCGIPARYVEGYALQSAYFEDGTLQENKNYDDYYEGYNELGETGVIRCEINDSQAHAWVEYYDEDFGWRVAEFTPPSSDDEENSFNFWDSFSSILNTVNTPAIQTTTETVSKLNRKNFQNIFDILAVMLKLLILATLAGYVLFVSLRLHRNYFSKDRRANLLHLYQGICDCMRKKMPAFYRCHSHTEQIAMLDSVYHLQKLWRMTEGELQATALVLEELSYSWDGMCAKMSNSEYRRLRKQLFSLRIILSLRH